MATLVIHSADVDPRIIEQLESDLRCTAMRDRSSIRFKVKQKPDVASLRLIMPHDLNLLPDNFDPDAIKLVISDMDSTLINIECIDEIADMAGVKDQVATITDSAMRGQLDFSMSLRQRVALLKGVSIDSLAEVYNERLKLNPGGEELLNALQEKGIQFSLVSGGFHFFADRLMARYKLNDTLANNLVIDGGKLTGELDGPIIDANAKADYLLQRCRRLGIKPENVLAIGDGANDLDMLAVAGIGVAYHAKPVVQQQADCALNYSGLDGVLTLLGLQR